jgi:amidohydrolase
MITDKIKNLSNQYFEKMVSCRHEIHMHPELAFEEFATSRLVVQTLADHGIPSKCGIAGTGVVALIEGRNPGKTVMLRADMDALPIDEAVDVEYRSRIPNRMHACGHDGNVAGLLGAAMILNDLRDEFDGNVKLVFQPAEERGGGAPKMIQAGVLKDPPVDAAFACHVQGKLQEGKVQFCPGPMLAASGGFKFRITGKGGHAGHPHLSVDPITIGAQAITYLQTIVSRRINPLEPAVISIGAVHSGQAGNVIPDSLEAVGTIRVFNPEVYEKIIEEMENILKRVTQAEGAGYSLEHTELWPALVNDEAMTHLACKSFAKIVGGDNVISNRSPSMSNEDFAFFGNSVPSTYIMVGIAKEENKPVCHHSAHFQWDDKNIRTLAEGMAQIAIDYLTLP